MEWRGGGGVGRGGEGVGYDREEVGLLRGDGSVQYLPPWCLGSCSTCSTQYTARSQARVRMRAHQHPFTHARLQSYMHARTDWNGNRASTLPRARRTKPHTCMRAHTHVRAHEQRVRHHAPHTTHHGTHTVSKAQWCTCRHRYSPRHRRWSTSQIRSAPAKGKSGSEGRVVPRWWSGGEVTEGWGGRIEEVAVMK